MNVRRYLGAVATALALASLAHTTADAQFGVNLPQSDFTWRWGDQEIDAARRRSPDFSTSGTEGGFRCDLTAKLRLGSRLTRSDVRQIESDLRVSLYFIQAATDVMNTLDRQRDLDWAELDCVKPQAEESTAEERQTREEEARQKAVQEMLERRERRQRQEEDDR